MILPLNYAFCHLSDHLLCRMKDLYFKARMVKTMLFFSPKMVMFDIILMILVILTWVLARVQVF